MPSIKQWRRQSANAAQQPSPCHQAVIQTAQNGVVRKLDARIADRDCLANAPT